MVSFLLKEVDVWNIGGGGSGGLSVCLAPVND